MSAETRATTYRVLVCGGRDYNDAQTAFAWLDALHRTRPISLIIHGACVDREGKLRGADVLAEQWAIAREVPYLGVPAKWSHLGRAAGPRRNGDMLTCAPSEVLALPGGKGTADMVRQALDHGVPVTQVGSAPPPGREPTSE